MPPCKVCTLQQEPDKAGVPFNRYLVIVEKDAIFQRLREDGFAELASAVLVTAKGMPDLATRAFAHAMVAGLPHLRPVAGEFQALNPVLSR